MTGRTRRAPTGPVGFHVVAPDTMGGRDRKHAEPRRAWLRIDPRESELTVDWYTDDEADYLAAIRSFVLVALPPAITQRRVDAILADAMVLAAAERAADGCVLSMENGRIVIRRYSAAFASDLAALEILVTVPGA